MHAELEEQLLYTRHSRGDRCGREATEGHHLAHVFIAQLKKLKPSDEKFAAKFIVLGELCKHHIKRKKALWGV
jgi:hypothetical protein